MENNVEIPLKKQTNKQTNWKIGLPYDPAIQLLGIHTKETKIQRDTCTPMFIAALFIIARTGTQTRCPLAHEWIKKRGTYTQWNITQPNGFSKGRGTRDQIANICWIIKRAREFRKHIYFCFIDYAKAFDCVDHKKLWKMLQEMGMQDHLTCLLRNFYAGQEATVRTGHGTTNWFQIGKGVHQGCILSPCLFNFYAEHPMRNAGLEEAQAGIKIARRNINNLRYADVTTLMAE